MFVFYYCDQYIKCISIVIFFCRIVRMKVKSVFLKEGFALKLKIKFLSLARSNIEIINKK